MKDHLPIAEKFKALGPILNEQGRRLWAATEAIVLGRGGVSLVVQAQVGRGRRSMRVCGSCVVSRRPDQAAARGGSAALAQAARGESRTTRPCSRLWKRWWSRPRGGIRSRRCAGPARACGGSRRSCGRRGMRSARRWWASCSRRPTTACKGRERRAKAASIRTATRSSSPSPPVCGTSRSATSRSSPSMPRRRNW